MSHVKNVDGFARIVDVCAGFGGNYTPGQRNLRVENLSTILTNGRQALTRVNTAKTSFENVNDDRKKVFVEIHGLAPRILAELKSSGASPDTQAAAAAMVRKIQGSSTSVNRPAVASGQAAASAAPTTPAPPAHSRTNGRDYGSVVYHFEKLIQTASTEPLYQPQTPDLQPASLLDKLKALQNGNAAVSAARAELGQARRDRNATLYAGFGSLHGTAMAVKQQVRAVFGAKSDAARAITHIHLTKTKTR